MWIRWIGGRGWKDALLRWLTALLLPFAGLIALTEVSVRFSLSTASMDYLNWLLRKQGLRGGAYMLAADLPVLAAALVLGIVMGAAIALLFRVRPLRIAVIAAAVPPLLIMSGAVMDGVLGGFDDAWRIGLVVLALASGIVLPPWLVQRHRRPGEAAALT